MQVDAIYHGTAERAKCVPSSLGAHGNVELGSSKADSRQIGRKGESELKRGEGGGGTEAAWQLLCTLPDT